MFLFLAVFTVLITFSTNYNFFISCYSIFLKWLQCMAVERFGQLIPVVDISTAAVAVYLVQIQVVY